MGEGGARAAPPQRPNAKPWFCLAGGGASPPSTFDTKPWYRTYTIFWLCVAGGEGHAPPLLRHKTTVCVSPEGGACPPPAATQTNSLCRKQSTGHKFIIYSWIATPALRQELKIGQLYNIIERLGWVWTQSRRLGTQVFHKKVKACSTNR